MVDDQENVYFLVSGTLILLFLFYSMMLKIYFVFFCLSEKNPQWICMYVQNNLYILFIFLHFLK